MKSLMMHDSEITKKQKAQLNAEDRMSQIINVIRQLVMSSKKSVYVTDLLKKIKTDPRLVKITQTDVEEVITYYKKLQVINVDSNNQITFL